MAGEVDALERRPSETKTEFELRRGTFESSLEELNRVLADADDIEIWGNIAPNAEYADVEFEATGIPGSSLGQLIESFGKTPDLYASIEPLNGSVLSGRMNYPVDELRRKNVNKFLDLLTADIRITCRCVTESERI